MKRRAAFWRSSLLLALLLPGWCAAQTDEAQINACRQGKASACEKLGYPKPVAKELAGLLKKRDKGPAEIAKKNFSEEALAAAALLSPLQDVALSALRKINSPDVILKVALLTLDPATSKEAFVRIKDESHLVRIATESRAPDLRLAAVERITDERALETVLERSRQLPVRLAAIDKLTNQDRLAALALSLNHADERLAALNRLHDQTLLADVVLGSKEAAAATTALAKITEESALLKIVRTAAALDLRLAALQAISDPQVAVGVALEAESSPLRSAALSKLDDPLLLRVIKEGKNPETRLAAHEKLRDQSALLPVMAEIKDEPILLSAIAIATNRADLERVVQKPCSPRARWAALAKLAGISPSEPLTLKPDPTFTNSIGMKFLWVEPQRFFGAGDPDRTVTIGEGYYLQSTEVTQAQWEAVMGTNPSRFKGADLPVENVSWADVQEFLSRLNAKEQGSFYRLPNEEEWECACRAGGQEPDRPADVKAAGWWRDNSGEKSHPVAQTKANAWGFSDLRGNVSEWVAARDRAGDSVSTGGQTAEVNVPGNRGVRGGSWQEAEERLVCAGGRGLDGTRRTSSVGFRCVMSW